MLYSGSFLISAIAFTLMARGETEKWARDDVQEEKVNDDTDASKELLEIKPAIVPEQQEKTPITNNPIV